jgi:hypothetical protein
MKNQKYYTVRKSSTLSEKVLHCQKKYYTVRKSTTLSEKVLHCQKKFYTVRKSSTLSEKVPKSNTCRKIIETENVSKI